MNVDGEFLRSSILTNPYAKTGKVLMKFFGVAELYSMATESAGSIGIGRDVVDVHGLIGADLAGTQGLSKDERIRLAGSDATRVNPHGFGEILKKTVGCLEMGDVNGIGVGEQGEAVGLGELLEQTVVVNGLRIQCGIPDSCKLVEIERYAQAIAQVQMPVSSRHAALLPVWPTRIFFDGGPEFLGRERQSLRQAELCFSNIYTDKDAANVKDDGAELRRRAHLLSASRTMAPPAGSAERLAFRRARKIPIIGGKIERKIMAAMMRCR